MKYRTGNITHNTVILDYTYSSRSWTCGMELVYTILCMWDDIGDSSVSYGRIVPCGQILPPCS